MHEKVEDVIEQMRPALQMDGGDMELIDYEDGIVTLKLVGACKGCPMSLMTLKQGIERTLKEHVPEVDSVKTV